MLDTEADKGPIAHLDNQVRSLRENMLAELRKDMQVALGRVTQMSDRGSEHPYSVRRSEWDGERPSLV